MGLLHIPSADRRLMPEGRFAGPMPWVIAIMMFLTILAAAMGAALRNAASDLNGELRGKLTVQIAEPNAEFRAAMTRDVTATLERLGNVKSATPLPEAELARLLDPWLGQSATTSELPIPAIIDVTLRHSQPADIAAVRDIVRQVAPVARVEASAQWLAPLSKLLVSLTWLSIGLVVLMMAATSAAVVLAARSALNTHRSTIDVLHLLGATDSQVATLFQRRIALDALFGGLAGLLLALVIMLLIGNRMRAIGSELLGSASLGWSGWLLIIMLPVGGALLSTLCARLTVLRALRQML